MSLREMQRTALVTGASSGIGATYAAQLARRGHGLVLVARDAARLDALAHRLHAEAGVAAEALPADLTQPEGVAAVERRLRQDPSIAMLVNNAGLGPTGPALASDPAQLDRMLALNVVAAHRLALAAARAFLGRGGGTIVNIASVVALAPGLFPPSYVASKAFVLALTESLAAETAGRGLRLQAVLPGLTRTEIFERAGHDIGRLDPEMVMEAEEMSRGLSGLDQGELVTSLLPEGGALGGPGGGAQCARPDLSRRHAASRYRGCLTAGAAVSTRRHGRAPQAPEQRRAIGDVKAMRRPAAFDQRALRRAELARGDMRRNAARSAAARHPAGQAARLHEAQLHLVSTPSSSTAA